MFEKLKTQKNGVEFLDFNSIPLNRDCHLLSDKDSPKIDEYWSGCIDSTVNNNQIHIHSMVEYYPCYFSDKNDCGKIYIEIFIGTQLIFIKTGQWLTKDMISEMFQITISGERPTIVLKDDILSEIKEKVKNEIKNMKFIK